MSRKNFILPLISGLFLVSGCSAGGNNFSGGSPQVVASPDKVSAMLAESADRASTALETLAAVERGRAASPTIAPLDNVPTELARTVSVNWIGPIEPIAKTLAERAGYGFTVMGANPGVPVVVSLDVENGRVVDALRDLGLQLGMRGDVRVDAKKHLVEINYAPNAGLGG